MGHSDIGVTLNTYTHLGYDDATDEMSRIMKTDKNKETNSDMRSFAPFSKANGRVANG